MMEKLVSKNHVNHRCKSQNFLFPAFQWVQNDLCEVSLSLKNPLPFELTVSDMRLLTNGGVFESIPQTVILPTMSTTNVTLTGMPLECGSVEIHGYSTHTLGVKSNCRLKHMMNRSTVFPPIYTIEVIPALPKLDIKTSLSPMDTLAGMANVDSIITSSSLTLYNGEQAQCTLTLTNTSSIVIEYLEGSIQSKMDDKSQSEVFSWSSEQIQSQLPLKPHESLTIDLTIFAHADFLGTMAFDNTISLSSSSHHNQPTEALINVLSGRKCAVSVSGHASLPSRMGSPTNLLKRNELGSSFRSKTHSANSDHSSLITCSPQSTINGNSRHIEAQFRFKYSGAEGLHQGYCRNCAVLFNLEFLPSAQITNWDVLPAET